MRHQRDWNSHAAFMNALVARRQIRLGGPLGNGERILLIIDAADATEAVEILDDDPWTSMDLLTIDQVDEWTILMDANHPG